MTDTLHAILTFNPTITYAVCWVVGGLSVGWLVVVTFACLCLVGQEDLQA